MGMGNCLRILSNAFHRSLGRGFHPTIHHTQFHDQSSRRHFMASAVTAKARPQGVSETGTLEFTREKNFAEWYRTVCEKAGLAENSVVGGCMVILPWGNDIWERISKVMDKMFKAEGVQNYKFPLFIPTKLMEAEAEHVAGFAPECAVVTHHRMKMVPDPEKKIPSPYNPSIMVQDPDAKLVMMPDPEAKLAEPLIVRPTSEVIIGQTMKKMIHSWRDMPWLGNQWCNVVRWEHRTTPFLRTLEFFWQEGHCAFADEAQARANAVRMTEVYRLFMEEFCALPVIPGKKSPQERFAGAVETHCLEAMMQDGKAVQAGTSHYLGQNFAKSSEIKFQDATNTKQFAHTTSWGVSTRLIGALIMTHGDDYGMRVPPRLAPYQVVIIPVGATKEKDEAKRKVEFAGRDAVIETIQGIFAFQKYAGQKVRTHVDKRETLNAGEKGWDWTRKGAPIRIEIGKREAAENVFILSRRDKDPSYKTVIEAEEIIPYVITTLGEIQANYYAQAKAFRDSHVKTDIKTLDGLKAFFGNPANVGFVRAKWCGDPKTEYILKEEFKVVIRCLPEDQSGTEGTCVLTGKPATLDAIFGRSY